MAGGQISIRLNSRNAVTALRSVILPYRARPRSLPDSHYDYDGAWHWVKSGHEADDAVMPLWTDHDDIAAATLLSSWADRFRALAPEAIYVIAASNGVCKIGVSCYPGRRLSEHQGSNAYKLELKALLWTNRSPRALEQASLGLFGSRGRRLMREWVSADHHETLEAIFQVASDLNVQITHSLGMLTSFLGSVVPSDLVDAESSGLSEVEECMAEEIEGRRRGRQFGTIR